MKVEFKINYLDLSFNNLTELTESDLKALCDLNNIKYNKLYRIDLFNNKLTNLDFIQPNTFFVNLKVLNLSHNKITDINNIQYLKELEILSIKGLRLNNEKQTVESLKLMENLKDLRCYGTFQNYTVNELEKQLNYIKIKIK